MSQYSFLTNVIGRANLPRMVQIGMDQLGVAEIPGHKSNPQILSWARELGIRHYVNDDIAWCGLFQAWVVKQSGREPVKNPLWARNWINWGLPSLTPGLGDVLVFSRGTGGHVGIYIAEDATAYHVLGGNQGNKVSIVRISNTRFLGARRPAYNNQPASVKPYLISASGQLSTNEA